MPHSSFLCLCSSCFLCWKYYPHLFSIPLIQICPFFKTSKSDQGLPLRDPPRVPAATRTSSFLRPPVPPGRPCTPMSLLFHDDSAAVGGVSLRLPGDEKEPLFKLCLGFPHSQSPMLQRAYPCLGNRAPDKDLHLSQSVVAIAEMGQSEPGTPEDLRWNSRT